MINHSLIGRKLILMVSDPWDFGTRVGCGPFEVIVEQESEKFLLLRLVNPWEYQDAHWEYLVAQSGQINVQLSSLVERKKMLASVIRTTSEQANADPETFGSSSYRGQYSMLTGTLELKA